MKLQKLLLASTSILLVAFFAASSEAQDKKIDVSGDDGRRGRDGNDTSDAYGSGNDASDAGDGTVGTHAQDAGDIDIEFKRKNENEKPIQGNLRIVGKIRYPDKGTKPIDNVFYLGNRGKVNNYAAGGDGGQGGRGGDAGDGSKGRDGSDATAHSSGDDGGPGGDGGDGGDGKTGGNAGAGGNITITTEEKNMDLLMLYGINDTSAGTPGAGGRAGQGGRGGRGGDGGSSYYERRYIGEKAVGTRSVYSGQDANGNAEYTTETVYESEYETITQPGGSDGRRGSDGRDGSAGRRGQSARSGIFTIKVKTPGGIKNYKSRYNLQLLGFKYREHGSHGETDGHFEPGESGHIFDLRVKNTGGMPLPIPANTPIEITLPDGSWLRTRKQIITLPKSLAAGETMTLKGEKLEFDLKDTEIYSSNTGVFKSSDHFNPGAVQTGVDRPYEQFNNSQQFAITFPLQITPIKATKTLLPGQKAPLLWKVKNVSTQPYGRLTNLKREIATALKTDPRTITTDQFEFMDEAGNMISLDQGFFTAISELQPGEESIIKGLIGIKSNAERYSKVGMKANLDMGRIHKPDEKRSIQFEDIVINVATDYKKTPGSKVLMITNNDTTPEELDAWDDMLSEMGLQANIWDTDYQGFLDFQENLVRHNTKLADDFEQSSVVMLNNDYARNGAMTQADESIPKRRIPKTIQESGIHFYLLGKDSAHYNERMGLYLLHSDEELFKEYDNIEKFKNAVRTDSLGKKLGRVADIPITATAFGDYSAEEANSILQEKSVALMKHLREHYPHERYYIIYDENVKMTDDGIRNTFNLGRLQIYKSLPINQTGITALPISNSEVHSEELIFSEKNKRGFISSLPLNMKIDLLETCSFEDYNWCSYVEDSLLLEFAIEQRALRENSKMRKDEMMDKLIVLPQIINAIKEKLKTPETKEQKTILEGKLINIVAKMHHMSEYGRSNETRIGGGIGPGPYIVVRRATNKFLDDLKLSDESSENKKMKKQVDEKLSSLNKEYKSRKKKDRGETLTMMDLLFRNFSSVHSIKNSSTVSFKPEDRILSMAEYTSIDRQFSRVGKTQKVIRKQREDEIKDVNDSSAEFDRLKSKGGH